MSAKTKRTTCPGSGNAPERVLRRAERVLIADRLSVHRGKAVVTAGPVSGGSAQVIVEGENGRSVFTIPTEPLPVT